MKIRNRFYLVGVACLVAGLLCFVCGCGGGGGGGGGTVGGAPVRRREYRRR